MRFEVGAAYAMGVGLPLLEAMRRKTDFEHFHSYVDDFIAAIALAGLFLATRFAISKSRT